jgi:dipeptidyl aminopeptidase/acylaminoacyl peptidase
MNRLTQIIFVIVCATTLAACGTLEVGVEQPPTPDAGAATVAALVTRNAELADRIATLSAPTLPPNLGMLAYVQGGDIWVKPLPTGEPQRLTTDGRNQEPRWSPSGRWLAFRKGDEQVWMIQADGGELVPIAGGISASAFAWAPDQDLLACVSGNGLYVVNPDRASQVELIAPSPDVPRRLGHIAWSPDGQWIAYEWQEQWPDQPPARRGIWTVSPDGNVRGEPVLPIADPLLAGWTGDSAFMLIQDGMNSAALLADGSPLYAFLPGLAPVKLADSTLPYADFVAPEPGQSTRVVVVSGGGREAWKNKRLVITTASTGDQVVLTPPDVAVSSPAWSPDGAFIAYSAAPDAGTNIAGGEDARQALTQRRIFVVNTQSNPQPRQITNDPDYRDERPLWSRDGSAILFARLDEQDRASLWLVPSTGGAPQRVVDELTPAPDWFGYYGHVTWDTLFDWWRGPAQEAQTIPAPVAVGPCNTPTSPLTLTLTYTDTEIGYAFDYPADWTIEANPGWTVILRSPDGNSKIDLLPDKLRESKTLDEMVTRARSGEAEILCEERWQLAGGIPAVRMQTRGELGEASVLLVVINGRSLKMYGYFDTSPFDAIARTIRPVP